MAVKAVGEGANMPCTIEAIIIFQERQRIILHLQKLPMLAV